MAFISKHSSSSSSSSASHTSVVTGLHQFKIVPFSHIKLFPRDQHVSSTTFTFDDCDWVIRFYPNGFSPYDTYPIVILELQTEDKKIENVAIECFLLDNTVSRSDKTKRSTCRTFNGRGSRAVLHYSPPFDLRSFVNDDCLAIECTISVVKPSLIIRSIVLQPSDSDLPQQFGSLLESEEGSDVAFEVNGETFNAHRCVLVARSPVFKAELFGHLKERMGKKIKVNEIEAPVFKAMLHFIYTDSLPEFEESCEESSNAMMQHLLVAANRYDLERLKILCAQVLHKNINQSNIFSVLVLAEQHNCLQLKDICLEFIAASGNLRDLMMADGFESLIQICPSIVNDLRKKIVKK